jgi:hypothetical protein
LDVDYKRLILILLCRISFLGEVTMYDPDGSRKKYFFVERCLFNGKGKRYDMGLGFLEMNLRISG